MQRITDNVYAETELPGCNCGFVVTKEGVVMIDTPMVPTDAIRWRDEIAKHGPVLYLINGEPHDDHFAGSHFFGGTVVGHEGTREAILAASVEELKERLQHMAPESLPFMAELNYRPPTITFSERLTLYAGNHTFRLIHVPGHTPFQVAVYVPEERVVFTSDNVVYRVQSLLSESLPYEWLDSLNLIQELEADVLVPGHGDICDTNYISEMAAFIQAWIDAVAGAIDRGMSLEETQDKVSLLDRYPMPPHIGFLAQKWQHANVARLYEVLKKQEST